MKLFNVCANKLSALFAVLTYILVEYWIFIKTN